MLPGANTKRHTFSQESGSWCTPGIQPETPKSRVHHLLDHVECNEYCYYDACHPRTIRPRHVPTFENVCLQQPAVEAAFRCRHVPLVDAAGVFLREERRITPLASSPSCANLEHAIQVQGEDCERMRQIMHPVHTQALGSVNKDAPIRLQETALLFSAPLSVKGEGKGEGSSVFFHNTWTKLVSSVKLYSLAVLD